MRLAIFAYGFCLLCAASVASANEVLVPFPGWVDAEDSDLVDTTSAEIPRKKSIAQNRTVRALSTISSQPEPQYFGAVAGGEATSASTYSLNSSSGTVVIEYEAYTIPDSFDVSVGGSKVFNSGGTTVSGAGTITRRLSGGSNQVTVTVNEGGGLDGTEWVYRVSFFPSEYSGFDMDALLALNPQGRFESLYADPIDMGSGAHVITKTLLTVVGANEVPLVIDYNSLTNFPSQMGFGWDHNFAVKVVPQQDGSLSFEWNARRINTFVAQVGEPELFRSQDPAMIGVILLAQSDGTYEATFTDQSKMVFNASGHLVEVISRRGHRTIITYSSISPYNALIDRVTDEYTGRYLDFTYYNNNLLYRVDDPLGRRVQFTYTDTLCLSKIEIQQSGFTDIETSYTYTDDRRILEGFDGEGRRIFSNTYDSQGRVVTQDDGVAGNLLTTLTYEQDPETGGIRTTASDRLGNTLVYRHDSAFHLVEMIDQSGRSWTYSYDTTGNRISTTNPVDATRSFTYDANRNLLSTTDAEGNTTALDYNSKNFIISSTNPLGHASTFEYDAEGNLLTVTDAEGAITRHEYNTDNFRVASISPEGRRTEYTELAPVVRDAPSDLEDYRSFIDSTFYFRVTGTTSGSIWGTDTYTDGSRIGKAAVHAGLLAVGETAVIAVTIKGPQTSFVGSTRNGVASSNYGSWQGSYSVSLPAADAGPFIFSDRQNDSTVNAASDGDGNTWVQFFDHAGRLTCSRDPAGEETVLAYDQADRLVTLTNPLGETFTYTYDSHGQKIGETNPLGFSNYYEYDANGNLVRQLDAMGYSTTYRYDGEDRLITTTDPRGYTTRFEYDPSGLLITVINAAGEVMTYEYDGAARRIAARDPSGYVVSQISYTDRDLVEQTQDALLRSYSSVYDAVGRLIEAQDPKDRSTSFEYDRTGRLTVTEAPDGSTLVAAFDRDGNRTSLTDERGNTHQFIFNTLGQLQAWATPMNRTTAYGYDSRGMLAEVIEPSGQTREMTYDAAGRLTTAQDSVGSISYSYDALGRLVTTTEGGRTIRRWYDPLNRVIRYDDGEGNTLRYAYDANGNLVELTYPDGKVVRYTYDAVNRLLSVTDWDGRLTRYTYDANGRLSEIAHANGTYVMREYNINGELIRLQDFDPSGNTIKSTLISRDAVGNIVQELDADHPGVLAGESRAFTHNADNQVLTINGVSTQYDLDGNLVLGMLGPTGPPSSLSYDARNRLTAVSGESYRYNAENHRVAVLNAQGTTRYVIDPNAPLSKTLLRTRPDGTTTYYVYGLGLLYEVENSQTRTYHYDLRGSTFALSNSSGSVTDRISYSPYGSITARTGSTNTPFLFNGRYGVKTDNTGLIFMRARYYSPHLGRFINQDPIGLSGGINLYAYAGGEPISYIDPFGLSRLDSESGTGNWWTRRLDNVQTGLDFAGLIPVIGEAFDLANGAIYAARGDYLNAGLSAAAAIPFAGWGATGAKLGLRYGDDVLAATNKGDEFVDVYRAFGDDARAQGFSWTTRDPRTVSNFRDAAGLPSGGASGANNSADFLIQGRARASDIIESRSALPLDGNRGGLPELIIDPKNVDITDFSVLNP